MQASLFASVESLRAAGFVGFETIRELRRTRLEGVPEEQGVYIILRTARTPPRFLPVSTGGKHKGREATEIVTVLERCWVPDSPVLYIGKGGGEGLDANLWTRMNAYFRFGAGRASGHRGGRYIWQLADADELVACWKQTPHDQPRHVERSLLAEFVNCYGCRPFANGQA